MPRTPAAKLVAEPGPGGPRFRREPKPASPTRPGSSAAKRDPRSRALALRASSDRIVRYLPAAVLALVEDASAAALRARTDDRPSPEIPRADEELCKDPVTDKVSPGAPVTDEPPPEAPGTEEEAPEAPPKERAIEGVELDVAVPLGRAAWCSEPVAPEVRRFGSHSDPGPATAESDKGNQDFAFHLELDAAGGATWVLAGVADGVSQATWAARGARHAAGAFIEAFADLAVHADFPGDEIRLAGDAWAGTFARLFHERLMGRLARDRETLLAERRVDATWSPELFGEVFWTGPNVEKERGKWFQSTLLAAALGPHGGFALLLGDGFARIDRRSATGAWQSSSTVPSSPPVSFGLARQSVFNSVMRLAARGAAEMGVMVTTDGVSKSSGEGLTRAMDGLGRLPGSAPGAPLESFAPASSLECRTFLRRLATLGGDLADIDNMSVAFAARALEAPRAP